jgi:hypothetical protein
MVANVVEDPVTIWASYRVLLRCLQQSPPPFLELWHRLCPMAGTQQKGLSGGRSFIAAIS